MLLLYPDLEFDIELFALTGSKGNGFGCGRCKALGVRDHDVTPRCEIVGLIEAGGI